MIRRTRIPAIECTCDRCMYHWYSIAKEIPDICRNPVCRTREWNGVKARILKPKAKIELPKPGKIREYDSEDF